LLDPAGLTTACFLERTKLPFLVDTLATFILFSFLFSPHICLTQFLDKCHLSQNGETSGYPFTEGTCWTLLVEKQHVFLEHTKLLFLVDTLATCILFQFLCSSPICLTQFLDLLSVAPEW
jgi:hypothetical protein